MDKKRSKESDLFIQFALAAARMAMDDAGLGKPESADAERWGSIIGVGIGGLATIEATAFTLPQKGPGKISPYFIPRLIANLAPGQISIVWGLKGPNLATVSACS